MGTRHLICAIVDGEYKVAQYGQWDGYPSGQGRDIANILVSAINTGQYKDLRDRVKRCRFLTKELANELIDKLEILSKTDHEEYSREYSRIMEPFDRETSAKIFQLILDEPKGLMLQDSLSFGKEPSMGFSCEWSYVVDFDNDNLEIYKGGLNGKPVKTINVYQLERSLVPGGPNGHIWED
jgi:hypothetical protein